MQETIKKYQFREGLKLEFEILDLNQTFEAKKEMMVVPHRAQFYHILWIEKGEGTHYIDFNPVGIEDNTLLFVPLNAVNKYDANCTYLGKAILFTDSFFCKNKEDLQFLHASILYSDLYGVAKIKLDRKSSDLRLLFDAMQKEYGRKSDSAQYAILHNMLHIFLLQAEREMRLQGFTELKPSTNLDCLVLFKDLLEGRFREEKSVNKYASELSISEKQLNKACTSLLDKTPKQIIDERIVLEAKRLLVHGHQSIKEIAYELGYDEPTNFIKYFRKHTNTTPCEFRENY
ncbi:AraC family transcriptional regulator [Carboxylicivirga sp. N1Y90]|uniref:AraC family transcriptional regulator n=1 Tax=Carboxylicivirga fragile TaxID=3417571 RepID=UPI003D35393E|nr:helix-turn-helix domain-containing protein [Marinilabiliaceae bacterium N1Y90]